jgi:signal transduction histidine kinase/ligand-binding sensor domain-containing protein/DNA-binding response OmpR family regulator
LLLSLSVSAQNYNFSRIDNTIGLSNNQIECSFKDSRGFMWFGTNFGLNRWDGHEVKVYKSIKNDSTTISYNAIHDIEEDENHNLWIRVYPYYVIYDAQKDNFIRNIQHYLEPYGVNFTPTLVEIDKKNNFYFYRPNTGIYKYDVSKRKLILFPQSQNFHNFSKGTIVDIKISNGSIWALFQSGTLERLNEKTGKVDFRDKYVADNSSGAFIMKTLFVDNDGCPWVFPGMKDKGVFWYDFSKKEWIYFGSDRKDFKNRDDVLISSDFVRDVAQEANGKIWIATDHGGIDIFDKSSRNVNVLRNDPQNPNSLSQNSPISLYYDNTGIMWVGTYKNGVSYYHPGIFKFEKSPLYYYQNEELENKDCNTLYIDKKDNLWIGTNGSGLLKYSIPNKSFQLYRNKKNDTSSISSDIIISSSEDKNGNMWFGTFLGGLNQMKGEKFIRYQSDVNNPNSLSNNSIYGLITDAHNNLWIGTLGGGVDLLDTEKKIFHRHDIGNSPQLSSNFILSMYSKKLPYVYLSTSAGIDLLNTQTGVITSIFSNAEIKNKLSDLIIYNTIVDSYNQLWIATDNGINIYNPKTNSVRYLQKPDGLPSEQVVSLIEDNDRNIWAGTRNGLACIYAALNPKTKNFDYSIVSFDDKDGLLSSIFNQNAVFKDKAGKIYFGCTKGYTAFEPNSIKFNRIAPKPLFCSLYIDNQEVLPNKKVNGRIVIRESFCNLKKLVLNYKEKNFAVHFSAMSYIHPEKNKYKYKLSNVDNDWIETNKGEAIYSNLNTGTYELSVYAGNNDNVWCKTPITLQIIIRPPFWLTWWAKLIYILLLIAALWFIINYNLRRQKMEFENEQQVREAKRLHEMDEMKFRFFTNISHEFRTPLTLILNPVEELLKSANNEQHKNLLTIIQRNATGLLELVNQLLDFRKLDVQKDTLNLSVGDVVSFIREICYSFTDLATKKSLNFGFSTSINELRMEFDAEKLRKIVYNLLSNAFKFTPDDGTINVNLSLVQQSNDEKNYLKIVVSDTGIGIPEKDLEHIFERFYRVENPENGHQTGTGVGLHIVSEYVKLHHGEVKVESSLGKGAVFTVLIPSNQEIKKEILSSSSVLTNEVTTEAITNESFDGTEADENEADRKRPLMLIVDDNEDFRYFISNIFRNKYRIVCASDGESALKMTLQLIPDIVICDVMMPKMDGYEYCRQVKSDIRISQIPIILLTAKTGDENKFEGLEAGAEDYISKPFNTEMLLLKVSRIIERQKKNHENFKAKVDISPSQVEITSMDEKFVKKAVALVEANINNPDFLVEDLCREIGMSRVYFYKKILALTDKTPIKFIRYIRLKRAAELLEKSQMFVNEIAYQVGFNDPKIFSKYFKEEFGTSPNEYKKRFQKS